MGGVNGDMEEGSIPEQGEVKRGQGGDMIGEGSEVGEGLTSRTQHRQIQPSCRAF